MRLRLRLSTSGKEVGFTNHFHLCPIASTHIVRHAETCQSQGMMTYKKGKHIPVGLDFLLGGFS